MSSPRDRAALPARLRVAVVGAGISLAPNAVTALESLGYEPAVRPLLRRQPAVESGQRDPRGRWLTRTPPEVASGTLFLTRAELHEILQAPLPGDVVHTGVHVTAADAEGGRLTLTNEAGRDTVLEADLVVGADGPGAMTGAIGGGASTCAGGPPQSVTRPPPLPCPGDSPPCPPPPHRPRSPVLPS